MNIQRKIREGSRSRRVALNVDQFWHLKMSGAFSQYGKSELLEGDMSGVPLLDDGEPDSDASVPIKLRVQDYMSLDEAGLLADNGRTELIDGILYEISPQYRPHWYAKNELTYRLRRSLEKLERPLFVGTEGSIYLSDIDLPEPDIVVTSEPSGAGPIPRGSVRLLVEVADSTKQYDLGAKSLRYAAASVPEYWVVDIQERMVIQYWTPTAESFAEQRTVAFGESLTAMTIQGLTVETQGL